MSNFSKRITRNSKIEAYLLQLHELTGRQVSECELTTVAETEEIRAGTKGLTSQEKTVLQLELSNLHGRRFRNYIDQLKGANPAAVYIWLHATASCGAMSVPSIAEIKFAFDHQKFPEGVIVFLAADCKDRMLLDFDAYAVEIEVQGASWTSVKF